MQRSCMRCHHAERAPEKKVCGDKSPVLREHHLLPPPTSVEELQKKQPEDQTSLISCHWQRGILRPHPAAADETAQPTEPAAQ